MDEVQRAALRNHGIVVEIDLKPFPQLEGEVEEADIFARKIIGADDGGIAPDIAETDTPALQHRDIADAVILGKIIGACQAMTATADDDDIIGRLGHRLAPSRAPAPVAAQRL